MTDTAARPVTHMTAIRADLAEIIEQARWAHTHGHWKMGVPLDAVRGASLRPPTPAEIEARVDNPDHVGGPRYDIEAGDHRSRTAYGAATKAVSLADFVLAHLLVADGVTRQPTPERIDHTAPVSKLVEVAGVAAWRASQFDDKPGTGRLLRHLRTELDRAVRTLRAALDVGPVQVGPADPCKTCQIREKAKRRTKAGKVRAHRGGECDCCAQHRARYKYPRPPELDHETVHGPRAAQARRLSRGEGWGAA